jgi:peptide/nickel transport system permease protein
MVSDLARFVFDRPLLAFYPGIAITVTVLALNLMGAGLVRALDPTGQRSSHL